jgi:capsular exopolysaccharide synthesis family protein
MSRIFDALQRSEAEQSEIDLSSGTTEVLQRSERRAANMSRIFDALQRSEAERSAIDLAAPSEATEPPQRAERSTASKWETAVLRAQTKAPRVEDRDASFGFPGESVHTGPATPALVEYSRGEEQLDPFAQFQSLPVSLGPQSRLVCLTDSGSAAAEAFRLLGVRLRHLRRDRSLKNVLITSTIPQEGKSMVAGNLACTLALKTQQRTLLLEGDLRRPSLSQMFGLGRNPGLSECLLGDRSLTTSIYHLKDPNLWILPSGGAPSNALELLQSGRLSALMDQLTLWFDWIIVDSPPLLPLADTSVWMRMVDGILLTTRQGTTEKPQLKRGLEAIEPRKLIGAVLNSSEHASTSDYYYRAATDSGPNDPSFR